LCEKKGAKSGLVGLLDIFEGCLAEKATISGGNGKTPLLKKRELEDLEAENLQLKQRLLTLASFNKQLMKKMKTEQEE
jgi:hypothetical protein